MHTRIHTLTVTHIYTFTHIYTLTHIHIYTYTLTDDSIKTEKSSSPRKEL